MESLHLRVPDDGRLRVSAADFASVLNAAAARRRSDPADRYAAAVLACGQWIAGLTRQNPLNSADELCTPATMQSCQMAADAVVYAMPWADRTVHVTWARGVAAMVSWARGASRHSPFPVSGARAA